MSSSANNPLSYLIIIANSLIYFLLAYFFVVLVNNLFSILLALPSGFDAVLYYYGYGLSGEHWNNENIFIIFFIGSSITLFVGLFFEYLYVKHRKKISRRKFFFMWTYILAYTWFFGNIIVGAFFNFGMGAAIRAMDLPLFVRLIFAFVGLAFLGYMGYNAQKNVVISANSYFTQIPAYRIGIFFLLQVILPAIFGVGIVALFKMPHLADFDYLDMYVLMCVFLFIIGLLIRFPRLKTLQFKRKNDRFALSTGPLLILIVVILILRVGLMNGLQIS
ncbi:MAG: hypothetical protein K9G58_09915 [Bacteroidales bacterium]|nr:hypothetical protein [Bacteroidales bacterium]MCF8388533.1 hypothetical protein [Bacteroidales bacterium]MCF8398475.1 hypothetical protein [Bacteroidales bacterium]